MIRTRLKEGQAAKPLKVNIRGNPAKHLGEEAAPLPGDPGPATNRRRSRRGSGRLELAQAIASKDNPLTARVLVNRVWKHHFGKGIVRTPSNFGKLGERPTHPELLDQLAFQFMASGWSIKKLHRDIMLSATYQLSSRFDGPGRRRSTRKTNWFGA